jgi:phosphoribosylanthranilate isomerase
MLNGPNLELLEEVASQLVIPVIQSGGIGSLDHLRSLKGTRAEGVIVGRAIYEGKFSVSEAITAVSGA